MIEEVALFVTDIGAAAMARQMGSHVTRTAPRSLVPTADRALGLGGQLESYLAGKSLQFENVPDMSDAEWKQFLDGRFPGQTWSRWFGKTPSAIYSVVVVES